MIFLRYFDELFAIKSIPKEFWSVISEDLRYDGILKKVEGFTLLLLTPIAAGLGIIYYNIALGAQFYTLLIGGATLFVGFAMNAVLLLLRYSDQEAASELLIAQTRNLISYLLYLGVALALLGLLGYVVAPDARGFPELVKIAVSAASIFTFTHFLIIVLFLPARIFTIIEKAAN